MSAIQIAAPFAGWAASLDAVPDPVFSERMMGDGIAVDPLDGVLRAPCDADVIMIAPTSHAITLRLANGAELLLHIGLETVGLNGEGFTAAVTAGSSVRLGDALIRFDLDAVARAAKSLVTPIVVANEGFSIAMLATDKRVAAGDALMEITADAREANAAPVGDDSARCDIVVPLAHGIHARPAARIGAALKPFTAEVRFEAHGKQANARSAVSLMTLGLKYGDALTITGRGEDARAAVTAVAALIEGGMGEAGAPSQKPEPGISAPGSDGPIFSGVRAAPGLAIGPAFHFQPVDVDVAEQGQGAAHESAMLNNAIRALVSEMAEEQAGPAAGIVAAHRALLEDPEIASAAQALIGKGKSAAFAWRAATRTQADALRATGDALLIERVADLIDVERQLIQRLLGGTEARAQIEIPPDAILIAGELLPSEFLALDAARLGGIATAMGGPTSHVAILAASAGVPMIVAVGPGLSTIADGKVVILNADAATLDSDPDAARLAALSAERDASAARRAAEAAAASIDCLMADGVRIEIFANLASVEDAHRAIAFGAEGCGLLRTEFLFERSTPPSENEQRKIYAAIATALGDRPIIVRTLDIGADKPVPYLPMPAEENPALGQRGIRLGLARPELLATQFRAIISAIPPERCMVMVPMIVDPAEFKQVRAIFEEAAAAIGISAKIPLGVMIETPSAALLAAELADGADFLSIGSNDLTQYALAADRGNPAVAGMIDALHPAVLRLIAQAAAGHDRPVGLCGSLASDPRAAALLIGLGITELSAAPAAIPGLKARVRTLDMARCRALAERALKAASVAQVHALLEEEG